LLVEIEVNVRDHALSFAQKPPVADLLVALLRLPALVAHEDHPPGMLNEGDPFGVTGCEHKPAPHRISGGAVLLSLWLASNHDGDSRDEPVRGEERGARADVAQVLEAEARIDRGDEELPGQLTRLFGSESDLTSAKLVRTVGSGDDG